MNANEPAYPVLHSYEGVTDASNGLTKREHAAILLRVPMSGDPEIDDMICAANRKDAAAMAMQGLLASDTCARPEQFARWAVADADALLAELAKEQK